MTIGILEVEVVKAKGLKGADFLGNIDPYVIVKYRSQERETSVAIGSGGNPVWNEKVRFRVEYPIGGDEDYKLILKIMDKDTFSRDDFLGQATIYLKDLMELGVENGKAQIGPQKYNVVKSDLSYSGEIQVNLTFTVKAEEVNGGEEYGGWKQSDI